jgi:hypothetical protein
MAKEGLNKIESMLLNYIEQQVQLGIERQELKRCDPQVTAFIMLKLYVALTADWRKLNEPLDKEAIKQNFRLYLIEGLAFHK